MSNLILAKRFKIEEKNGKRFIQLYDKSGNKVDGTLARWDGNFSCYNNQLTTLEGAPKEVGGNFYCNNNQLTSLEGAPKEVGGGFYCSNNQLTSLEGAPKEVGGNFSCRNNQLTSLEGAPKEVGGGFYCSNNQLTSLEGAPKEISKKNLNTREKSHKRIFESKLERGFIFADGILEKIISKKQMGEFEVFKSKKIGSKRTQFVVKKGDIFSHGESIKKAIEDLQYKVSDRDTSEYQKWNLKTIKTKSEIIQAYRKITGACESGTKGFVRSNVIPEKLTIEESIKLTKGRYGHEQFVSFFKS